jgi:hypothetical protein
MLLIVALAASSLMIIEPSFSSANTSYSLSVPEFSLKIVEKPYDVPPTYTFNPYTGEQVIEDWGYHVQNKSVQITITNQKFTPSDGDHLMYNIRWKGHYSETDDWSYLAGEIANADYATDYIYASGSYFTVVYGGLTSRDTSSDSDFYLYTGSQEGEVDIQIQTLMGKSTPVQCSPNTLMGPTVRFDFTGQSSGWSNTQAIDINKNTVKSNPTPIENITPQPTTSNTATPTTSDTQQVKQNQVLFGFEWKDAAIAVLCIIVATLTITLVVSRKKSIVKTVGEK